jgi:hypothetical protein
MYLFKSLTISYLNITTNQQSMILSTCQASFYLQVLKNKRAAYNSLAYTFSY